MLPVRERRKHVVYITRNTEYHCRHNECVGVRDRQSGQWRRHHSALRGRLVGATDGTGSLSGGARVGLRLLIFGSKPVVTSLVEHTMRPGKDTIWRYSSYCKAGTIDR